MRNIQRVVLSFLLLPTAAALGQLEWRVSVKFFLDANGNRPAGILSSNQAVQTQVNLGNAALAASDRGYSLRLTEIVDLSGLDVWFDHNVFDFKDLLEQDAESDPAAFAWRDDAINIYINNFDGSGVCSFPNDEVIFVGQGVQPTTLMHEIGHFFDLCHTQGCPCGACEPPSTGECHTTPGDDSVADTLPDLSCFDRNGVSNFAFGDNYANLTPEQQRQVDAVFFNIMSYHGMRDRFTPDQMDRMTDASNDSRVNETNGRTRFVDQAGSPVIQFGSSVFPFVTVEGGVDDANIGDVVLVRTGSYDETLTITKALTLRASRGNATIGQ